MKPALLVATKGWDAESWARRIRPLLPERPILLHRPRPASITAPTRTLAGVHYILAWKPLQETLDRLPSLRVIFSLGAGVDHIFALARLPDVPIVRIVDPRPDGPHDRICRVASAASSAAAAPTYAAAPDGSMSGASRPAGRAPGHCRDHGPRRNGPRAPQRCLLRLGFTVRGWTRSAEARWRASKSFHGAEGLDAFLAGTDILVSLLPLTPETRGLIDLPLLRKLRRDGPLGGPILINAGRGGSQVEADIVAALRDGTLAGASLDVFETEPLPADSPLWDFDNVVITPHVAAVSDPQALAGQIAGQIEAFERGEQLKNRVDPRRGY